MKKYVSAVLIPCLLLQFFGCYSQKVITLEELYSETDDEVIINLNNSDKYLLKSNVTPEDLIDNPDINYCINADTSVEKLILYKIIVNKVVGQSIFSIIDTIKINRTDIQSIYKTEINTANSIALTVGIIVLGVVILSAVGVAGYGQGIDFDD